MPVSSSVDRIDRRLRHNSKEKIKYESFFEQLKLKNVKKILESAKQQQSKLESMPKIKVISKLAQIEMEEAEE